LGDRHGGADDSSERNEAEVMREADLVALRAFAVDHAVGVPLDARLIVSPRRSDSVMTVPRRACSWRMGASAVR